MVEAWIEGALAGDQAAWMHLLGTLWERADRQVRSSSSLGQLRASNDDHREIVSRVFARLRADDFRPLRTFSDWQQRHPEKSFFDWFAIVVANSVREHVARRIGVDGTKRLVDTLAEVLNDANGSARPSITDELAAKEIIERAEAILPGDQLAALRSWIAGDDFQRIAEVHQLPSARDARARVRAAVARLRRDLGAQS